ncbi:hypothetical protein J056_002381 [Wallemia ichthyophaga EXF-994]|nr:uncharacterized protein J056_002381 [Wallemia ichthyophaga EXF-994]EOQ99256.1 hypothetical protein J056_002381 [Wallemia ichthyophaga EXF-994]
MQPSLNPDTNKLSSDILILNKWLPFSHFKHGDIIALRPPDNPNKLAIKRIIGLYGDTINDSYVDRGHCYVQGDETFHSIDSRQYGQISLGTIIGKGIAIVYPFDRLQWLH